MRGVNIDHVTLPTRLERVAVMKGYLRPAITPRSRLIRNVSFVIHQPLSSDMLRLRY